MVLHGREVEQARLADLVDRARRGRAGALVVRGEPGVGKSALLNDLIEGSGDAGLRVLRTQGLESESPLAFGALHRLLRPILDLLARLPLPQARALRVAFGAEDGSPVEPFLVGIATLSMLTEAAEEAPVLCVVDDAHWLDNASADALLFAARRLEADRVAIVFSARDSGDRTFTPDGVESLLLTGLQPDAVRALLTQQAGDGVADEVAERLLRETGGNPLALMELPANLTAAQLHGTAPLPAQLLVGTDVERVFLDRVRRLSPDAQTLMLVAAADDTGQFATVQRAAEGLGVDPTAWDEAEKSGLLSTAGDAGADPPSAGPIGGVSGGHQPGSTPGAPGAGRRHR